MFLFKPGVELEQIVRAVTMSARRPRSGRHLEALRGGRCAAAELI